MTHYIEADPIEWDTPEIVAIPHFAIEIEVSGDDWGTDITKSATLDFVMLGRLDPRGEVDGLELTAKQAASIWGEKIVSAWEEAAADRFDASEALADEAADRADHDYHAMRDERDAA